jgi:hypothetical protein
MFKKITRMKELLTIKHNWLYVCIKKDSKYYGKLKNTLYTKPTIFGKMIYYYTRKDDGGKIEYCKDIDKLEALYSFHKPNFKIFDFYICNNKNELKERIARLRK